MVLVNTSQLEVDKAWDWGDSRRNREKKNVPQWKGTMVGSW